MVHLTLRRVSKAVRQLATDGERLSGRPRVNPETKGR